MENGQKDVFLPGGTKEAAQVVKDFLDTDVIIIEDMNSVLTKEVFLDSVRVLLRLAAECEDRVPKCWYCEGDCCHISDKPCPGEEFIDNTSDNACPFYICEDK